jgi:hypothetical protein
MPYHMHHHGPPEDPHIIFAGTMLRRGERWPEPYTCPPPCGWCTPA